VSVGDGVLVALGVGVAVGGSGVSVIAGGGVRVAVGVAAGVEPAQPVTARVRITRVMI
jgi:hypothetical protein